MLLTSLLLIFIANISRTTIQVAASTTGSANNGDEGFSRLVAWMNLHGGRVDGRIDVAEINNGVRGVVALADIEDGAELLYCPWKLVIGSSGLQEQMQSGDDMCKVVKDMADEIRLHEESLWWPYLEHIQLPRLAAMWEQQSTLDELQGLSPSEDATRHIKWFSQGCSAGSGNNVALDEADMRSLVSFVSRASEVGMVPIYDLLNHHNGEKNAKLTLGETGVSLIAIGGGRPIPKGNEMYLSYGLKTAPTMYRDYGFVEDWPCCWNWKDSTSGDNFAFVVFPDGVVAINPTADFLKMIRNFNSHSTSIGSGHMQVADFQATARIHTESLPLEILVQFASAARNHLDGLPTTLQEDLKILGQKKELLLVLVAQALEPDDDNDDGAAFRRRQAAEDVISAIEYRCTFKKALESALLCSEASAQAITETLSPQQTEL